MVDVKTRVPLQREDGKAMELDIVARSACGRTLLVEVKKRAVKTGRGVIEDFLEKVKAYGLLFAEQTPVPAVLSLGGFTDDALALCRERGVAVGDKITRF